MMGYRKSMLVVDDDEISGSFAISNMMQRRNRSWTEQM